MYMNIMAQIQKEEIIPNSLNQIIIRSKILTFNLLSLNRNFTHGLHFSDRDRSMNTPPSMTTQISSLWKNTRGEVYMRRGISDCVFQVNKSKFSQAPAKYRGNEQGWDYRICPYQLTTQLATYKQPFFSLLVVLDPIQQAFLHWYWTDKADY